MSYEGRKKSESDIAQLHLVMLSSRILHEETQMCPRNARLLKEFARFVVHKKRYFKMCIGLCCEQIIQITKSGSSSRVLHYKLLHILLHSLIRGPVLKQSCSAGAKNFTSYVFCHLQFSSVIQNIGNCCAILTPVCLC